MGVERLLGGRCVQLVPVVVREDQHRPGASGHRRLTLDLGENLSCLDIMIGDDRSAHREQLRHVLRQEMGRHAPIAARATFQDDSPAEPQGIEHLSQYVHRRPRLPADNRHFDQFIRQLDHFRKPASRVEACLTITARNSNPGSLRSGAREGLTLCDKGCLKWIRTKTRFAQAARRCFSLCRLLALERCLPRCFRCSSIDPWRRD